MEEEVMAILMQENGRLIRKYDSEKIWIEPWGRDSLRVRVTRNRAMEEESWALLLPEEYKTESVIEGQKAAIRNGKITEIDMLEGLEMTNTLTPVDQLVVESITGG